MFFGAQFTDNDIKTQEEKTYTLKEDSEYIFENFTSALADIATLNNNAGTKTQIEGFFDALKKVMRLYRHEESSQDKKKDSQEPSQGENFYLYIYDEEEYQAQQRFNKRGSRFGRTNDVSRRKIGFWCFNAAVGIKQIAALKPRSIILTSGTLSPMDSF